MNNLNEMKKTIPITMAPKRVRFLGINLTKERCSDLYTENYKTSLKDIKEDINEWKDILYSWFGRPTVLGLFVFFCAWCLLQVFSSCGYSLVTVHRHLIAMDSLVAEHGLQGAQIVVHRLSCPVVCGVFSDQGSNLCPLASGFLTTGSPGKSLLL